MDKIIDFLKTDALDIFKNYGIYAVLTASILLNIWLYYKFVTRDKYYQVKEFTVKYFVILETIKWELNTDEKFKALVNENIALTNQIMLLKKENRQTWWILIGVIAVSVFMANIATKVKDGIIQKTK